MNASGAQTRSSLQNADSAATADTTAYGTDHAENSEVDRYETAPRVGGGLCPPTRRECCELRRPMLHHLETLGAGRDRGRRVYRRLDEFGHGCRLRDVNRVAARDLGHGRTRPRRHLTLRRWGIIRSSVATRYQLGLLRHAGSLIVPLRASTPHGTCESAMNAACSALTSPANEAWTFPGRGRETRPAAAESAARARGGRICNQGVTDSPSSGAKAGM
jgi:hypothetical protein